jgi:hypothetical protein
MPAHKNHLKNFYNPPPSLTYSEQAKSINAAMAWCSKAMRAHMRKAREEDRDVDAVKEKCINQVRRLLTRVEGL